MHLPSNFDNKQKNDPFFCSKTLIQTYIWQGPSLYIIVIKNSLNCRFKNLILHILPHLPSLLPTQLSVGITTLQPSSQLHHVSINTGYILHRTENQMHFT